MIRSFSASPIKSALAALAIVSGLAVPGAYAAQPTPPFAVDACGVPRGATGCTAEDIDIVSLSLTAGQPNPASCNELAQSPRRVHGTCSTVPIGTRIARR